MNVMVKKTDTTPEPKTKEVRDLRTTLCWTSTVRGCSLFAWEVTPATGASQTATYQRG